MLQRQIVPVVSVIYCLPYTLYGLFVPFSRQNTYILKCFLNVDLDCRTDQRISARTSGTLYNLS